MNKYVFEYSGNTYIFDKDEADKDKYIVFSCAKNEDEYILEFVEHYLSLGFDKVIIADNNDDQTIVSGILKDYIDKKQVQIFNCCGIEKFQIYLYNMFLKEGNYKWCAYFDCDEFLELNVHRDIKEFLNGIDEHCVLIHWVVFGSNGIERKEEGKVQDRFKIPASPVPFFKENYYVKPIIRGGEYNGERLTNTHCPSFETSINIGGYFKTSVTSHVYCPPRYKYAYIKHYYTKSFDEWMSTKVKRGWPDEMPKILRASNYFIVDKNPDYPENRYINGFFIDNNDFSEKKFRESYDEIMGTYEMIELFSSYQNVYSIILHAFALMKYYTNHVIVIKEGSIDDCTFGNLLEYAMRTGNKVCFAFNDEDVKMAFWNRTTWNKRLYYYIDCR